jgi:hypothetical protein
MTKIDLTDVNIYLDLPEGAEVRRLAGDWMVDGYVSNLNRPRRLEVLMVEGEGYVVGEYGYLLGRDFDDVRPVELDADGAIRASGAGVTFLPDDGEMARVGLA